MGAEVYEAIPLKNPPENEVPSGAESRRCEGGNDTDPTASPAMRPVSFVLPPEGIDIAEVERSFIVQAIALTKGNQTKAAEKLSLTRDAFRYRMYKFGLL